MDITILIAKVTAIIAVISGFIVKVKNTYTALSPIVEPFIKDVEERAKDHKIDKEDRKALAMTLIREAQEHCKLKQFGFFEKMIVSKVIDYVAEKLPDFVFNDEQG